MKYRQSFQSIFYAPKITSIQSKKNEWKRLIGGIFIADLWIENGNAYPERN